MLYLEKLKRGDTFWEAEYGIAVKYIATGDAYLDRNDLDKDGNAMWRCWATDVKTKQRVHFGWRQGASAYRPKLYKENPYGKPRG